MDGGQVNPFVYLKIFPQSVILLPQNDVKRAYQNQTYIRSHLLTIRTPCITCPRNCRSPAVPRYADVSTYGILQPPVSDLKHEKCGFNVVAGLRVYKTRRSLQRLQPRSTIKLYLPLFLDQFYSLMCFFFYLAVNLTTVLYQNL